MSVDELVAADPFVLTATDEEVELRALCRALTLADGFSLLFARCNQADHRRELIERIKAQLPNLNIQVVEFRERLTHLLDELRSRITSPSPDAVFVLGLEYSLPRSSDAHSSALVANLNAARNSFPQAIPIPLVLWVPEYIVTAISRGGPDFFSIRSGLYSFATSPSINTVRTVTEGDWMAVQNLSIAEKLERIESIKSLLEDYESLPTGGRNLSIESGLHYRLGILLSAVGSNDMALDESLASLKLSEELDDREGVAVSRHQIGTIRQHRGEFEAALEQYKQALKIGEDLDHWVVVAISLHQIGTIYEQLGEYDKALEHYERALKIDEKIGDRAGFARSLHQIGNVRYLRGEYDVALELYERSLKIKEELGDLSGVATSLHQIGNINNLRGEYGAALEKYERSMHISQEIGDRAGLAGSLHQIGRIHDEQGEYEVALDMYERSLRIAEEIGDREGAALSLQQIGKVRAVRGEYPEAFCLMSRAFVIFEGLRSPAAQIAQNNRWRCAVIGAKRTSTLHGSWSVVNPFPLG